MDGVIWINEIKEMESKKLQIDIKVCDNEEKRYIYQLECKDRDYNFYYIENLWLSTSINIKSVYTIKVKDNFLKVNKKKIYSNMVNSMFLEDIVIIYGDDIKKILLMKINNSRILMCNSSLKKYIKNKYMEYILEFFERIFQEKLSCNIFTLETKFQAVAFPNVIVVSDRLYKYPYTCLYKNIPHEIFHQCNGCEIKYCGNAKEWMRESLVEYLQLVCIKGVLGEKFFENQLKEYERLSNGKSSKEVTLYNFDFVKDKEYYNSLVYGRGVLLFEMIFQHKIENIEAVIRKLKEKKSRIILEEFLKILKEVLNIDTDYFLEYFIKENL